MEPQFGNLESPCAVCILRAVRAGVDYTPGLPVELIGQTYGVTHQSQIHPAVTTFAGTPVCWYHVDDVAKSQGM